MEPNAVGRAQMNVSAAFDAHLVQVDDGRAVGEPDPVGGHRDVAPGLGIAVVDADGRAESIVGIGSR